MRLTQKKHGRAQQHCQQLAADFVDQSNFLTQQLSAVK